MAAGGGRLTFWILAVALVASAGAAYFLLLGREPAPAAPAPVPPAGPAAPALTAVVASGKAERVRGGVRTEVRAGDALLPEDALETGPDGRLELAAGDAYSVVLEGAARLDVKEITATLARFRLAAGLVSARVRDAPGRTVEFDAGGGAVLRTTGGEVSVARSGRVVAVATLAGAAELSAAGGTTRVGAGQSAHVVDGERPGPAVPIPSSLLLKVSWPAERATNQARITVRGRTEPGAVLLVGGEPVEVAPDGTFTHVVYLREGTQMLSAAARAVGRREARAASAPVLLDTRPPEARFDTRGLWGDER